MDPRFALFTPQDVAFLLVDPQPGLAFVAQSMDHQTMLSNLTAMAKVSVVFGLPTVVTTSASTKFSGPWFPELRAALGGKAEPIERTSLDAFADPRVEAAVRATGRKRLLLAGLLTEACIAFTALHAMQAGYTVHVVVDACAASSSVAQETSLRILESAGMVPRTWLQVLLELQRDWTHHDTYAGAVAVVKEHAGNYGIGLTYAASMLARPPG
ncbi:MAG: isochorismatase family protein [Polyangiaceae bacterium]